MAGKVMDDLLYFGLGAVAAEIVDYMAVKYADPKANMHITMLGAKAGKPSVYIPGGTGIAALGYAAYQADKFGRLKDEEVALAGYGVYNTVKTLGKVLAQAAPAPAPAPATRFIPGGVMPRQFTPAPSAAGVMRGSV